jgi:hypothetical protein
MVPFLRRRWLGAAMVFLSFHLHLLCDVVGSGGGTPGDIWPIGYLYPFSDRPFFWNGQWPLSGWRNTTLTVALMLYGLWVGVTRGHTPVALFSSRADARLVAVLRARFRAST